MTIFVPLATTMAYVADDDMVGGFHMSLESLIAAVFLRKNAWECLSVINSACYPLDRRAQMIFYTPLLLLSNRVMPSRLVLFQKRSD